MMTQEQYLETEGERCPFCGSRDLDSPDDTVDGDSYMRGVTCRRCGKTWCDHFKLTGFSVNPE